MVYRNLKAEMARAGLTNEKLAQKLGMTKQAVGQKILGHKNWYLEHMTKIQDILENELGQRFSLDYLFETFEDNNEEE